MSAFTKTHLLYGILGLAGLGLVGMLLLESRAPGTEEAPGPPAPAAVAESAEAPQVPLEASELRIQAPDKVTTGQSGLRAELVGPGDLHYDWNLEGGAIETGGNSSALIWTSGAPGLARLVCRCTNLSGSTATIERAVVVEPLPRILRFDTTHPVLTEGAKAALSWETEDGVSLLLEPGSMDVTTHAGPKYEVAPERTTTYTLVAANAAGTAVTKNLTIKVVPPPSILATRTEGGVGRGTPVTFVCEFTGGTARLFRGEDLVGESEDSPLRVRVPDPPAGTAFRFVVSNEAKDRVTQTFNVVPTTERR